MLKQLAPTFIGIGIFIAAIIFFSSIYIVDETKQVFVTRFGEIVRKPINAPGTTDEAGHYHTQSKRHVLCLSLSRDLI